MVTQIFEDPDEEDNQNSLIAKCVAALPKSALVLEILDPPRGSYDGVICYACFDFDRTSDDPDAVRLILAEDA